MLTLSAPQGMLQNYLHENAQLFVNAFQTMTSIYLKHSPLFKHFRVQKPEKRNSTKIHAYIHTNIHTIINTYAGIHLTKPVSGMNITFHADIFHAP